MKNQNSLYIPKQILILASGIDERIINADIKSNVLNFESDEYIWYRTAAQYVHKKWSEGKVQMYDPYGSDIDHSFSSRVLSLMDDYIGTSKLSLLWKTGSNKK